MILKIMEYAEATYLKLGNFPSLEAPHESYYKHTSMKIGTFSCQKMTLYNCVNNANFIRWHICNLIFS